MESESQEEDFPSPPLLLVPGTPAIAEELSLDGASSYLHVPSPVCFLGLAGRNN